MSSFEDLFFLKAPNEPSLKNQGGVLIGAQLLSLGIVRKASYQALLDTVCRARIQRGIICFDIAPSCLLNYAVSWND